MDPFSPDDQSLPQNGNGKSTNGLNRNGFSKTGSSYGYGKGGDGLEAGNRSSLTRQSQEPPELIPVFEDQGERFDKARRSALKVYIVLIVIGVIIGGISLFGIAMLMQHFGLTDVPSTVEQR
ncbi:MAG: hypothetical protein AAGD25_11460 [Cyanobacteria bacterium P01_F01_bin.150]